MKLNTGRQQKTTLPGVNLVIRLIRFIADADARYRQKRLLDELSDDTLDDVGLTRDRLASERGQSAWNPPIQFRPPACRVNEPCQQVPGSSAQCH